jgi:hypothetical protein
MTWAASMKKDVGALVHGGGPMTISMPVANTVRAAEWVSGFSK